MRRFIILITLVFTMAGCAFIPQPKIADLDPNANVRVAVNLVEDSIVYDYDKKSKRYGWTARFTFEESSDDCNCIVSEIWMDDGYCLVETFLTPGGALPLYQRDTHWRSDFNDDTTFIYTYPAVVEDAEWTNLGFAMLAENRDGSVKTNVGPNFNTNYQQKFPNWKKQGRIVKDERAHGIWWAVQFKDGKLNVFIPSAPLKALD